MITEFNGEPLDQDTIYLLKQLEIFDWDLYGKPLDLPKSYESRLGNKVLIGEKFVVKQPLTIGREEPMRACPTKVLKQVSNSSRPNWVIQPRCKTFYEMKPEEVESFVGQGLLKKDYWDDLTIPTCEGGGADCHQGNFGMLNGELV